MRKIKNLNFNEFVKMFNYYGFAKTKKEINGILYNGYIYKLVKRLTTEQKEELKQKYKNIIINAGFYEYASEIKFDTIFIAHSKSKAKLKK